MGIFKMGPSVEVLDKIREQRYHCDNHMFISNVACSDKNKILPLYYDKPGSTLASLTKRDLSFYNINMEKTEDVQCIKVRRLH